MTDILILLALALALCGLIVLFMYGVASFWRGVRQDNADATGEKRVCPPCDGQCNQGRYCPRWLKQTDTF